MLIARIAKRRMVKSLHLQNIRQVEPSLVCSADDDADCNDLLIKISLAAITGAKETSLKSLVTEKESLSDARYYDVFPGEHYRLLHSLSHTLAPSSIVEIGTFTGMSAAAILDGMPQTCKFTTFDINSWREHQSHLSERDFQSGRITQVLDDLSNPDTFDKYLDLFSNSQFIFCDAPKDGIFEHKFLANLSRIRPNSSCLLVLDDIRLLNMIDVWRSIASPKLDLTSFGHWSGTGLVDMSAGLKLKA